MARRRQLTLTEIGLLDVTAKPYGADPTGKRDATAAIQQAVKDAYQQELVCFFPAGTYLVTDTIYAPQDMSTHDQANCLIGSTAGAQRPRLVLPDNTPGFGDPAKTKPVVWIWTKPNEKSAQRSGGKVKAGSDRPEDANAAMGFCQVFRGIDIEIGAGNDGAVGLNLPGAQHCEIADVTVTMRSGFAGFYNFPGVNGVIANLKVVGGQYGVYCPDCKWPTIIGSEFIDQTVAAIGRIGTIATLVGCRIVKRQAPAIRIDGGGAFSGGCLSVVDTVIDIEESSAQPAIDNTQGRTVVLANVFLRNATQLIQNGAAPPVAGGAGWIRAGEYATPMKGQGAPAGVIAVDGREVKGDYANDIGPAPAPDYAALRDSHLYNPSDYPSPDVVLARFNQGDPAVAILTGFPGLPAERAGWVPTKPGPDHAGLRGPDVTETLQRLLDTHSLTLVPKGYYLVKQTITLRGPTHLMGVANHLAELRPHDDWRVTQETPILTTEDSASAAPKVSWLKVGWSTAPLEHDWFSPAHWRAGRDSRVRGVFWRPYGAYGQGQKGNGKAEVRIAGHGGGRWYGTGMGPLSATEHPAHRRYLIDGTREPLAFYNLNIERGFGAHQMEIRDARNIAIYGLKNEFPRALLIKGSENVSLFGQAGNAETVVEESRNLLIANTGNRTREYDETALLDKTVEPPLKITSPRQPAYIKHGQPKRGVTAEKSPQR